MVKEILFRVQIELDRVTKLPKIVVYETKDKKKCCRCGKEIKRRKGKKKNVATQTDISGTPENPYVFEDPMGTVMENLRKYTVPVEMTEEYVQLLEDYRILEQCSEILIDQMDREMFEYMRDRQINNGACASSEDSQPVEEYIRRMTEDFEFVEMREFLTGEKSNKPYSQRKMFVAAKIDSAEQLAEVMTFLNERRILTKQFGQFVEQTGAIAERSLNEDTTAVESSSNLNAISKTENKNDELSSGPTPPNDTQLSQSAVLSNNVFTMPHPVAQKTPKQQNVPSMQQSTTQKTPRKRTVLCEVCNKTVNGMRKRHANTHLHLTPIKCALCLELFRRKDNAMQHLKNKHPGADDSSLLYALTAEEEKMFVEMMEKCYPAKKHDRRFYWTRTEGF